VLNIAFHELRSQVARSATIYLCSYAISLGIPFFLLPVMTRYIDPEGYGHVAMFQMLLAIMSGVIGFSLRDPIMSIFSVKPLAEKARFLSSSLVIETVLFITVAAVVVLARHVITGFTDLSGRWLTLVVVGAFAYVVGQANFTIIQSDRQAVLFAKSQIFFSVLSAAIGVVAVVVFKAGWAGRVIALAAVPVVSAGWAVFRFRRCGLITRVNRRSLLEAFTFGASSLPFLLSTILAAFTDRITLRLLFSFQDVGVYTVAAYLALGFAAFGDAVNLAVVPWAYRQLDRMESVPDFMLLARRAVILFTAMAILAVVYFWVMREYALRFMPSRFTGVLTYLPWLVADAWCIVVFQVLSVVLFHYRKKAVLSWFGGGALVGCATLVYLFSMALGPVGAAIGLFVTHVAVVLALLPVASWLVFSSLGGALRPSNPAGAVSEYVVK
jgi:O-antigen/teichoic acid export membrane protein